MRKTNLLLLSSFLLALARVCAGQTVPVQIDAGNATGVQPYVTYGGARENINLATGDVNLQIPLLHLPGRGGLDLSLALVYDSKIWDISEYYDPTSDTEDYAWAPNSIPPQYFGAGWNLTVPSLTYTWGSWGIPGYNIYCIQNFTVTLSDGSKHSFPFATAQCVYRDPTYPYPTQPAPTDNNPVVGTNDATYMLLDLTSSTDWIVYLKNGTRLHFPAATASPISTFQYASEIEDTNGNFISYAIGNNGTGTITDTVGRVVTITTGSPSSTISYKDSSGTAQTITLSSSTVSISPTFTYPSGSSYQGASLGGGLSSVTLPTGRGYTFQYNNFAELTKITYPEGGYTRYDYAPFVAIHYFKYAGGKNPIMAVVDFREITARHVCQSFAGNCTTAAEYTTIYSPTLGGTTITTALVNNQYNAVTDPLGNVTNYQFNASICGDYSYLGNAPRELTRWVYQGSSTLLRTIATAYNDLCSNAKGVSVPSGNSLPISRTTTLNDVTPNHVKETTWTYDTTGNTSIDNVTNESDYDYGSGSAGPLLRQTVRTWLKTNSVNGTNYTADGIYILDRKLTENIEDGSSNVIAQTQYQYDNYGSIAASGAIQHDAAFASSTGYNTRGNVTTSSKWLSSNGTWLATTKTYDDAANVLTRTDPKGNVTTFSYADSWANTGCQPTSGNGAAYVTSVTNALTQKSTYKYNSCTGTMASLTDPNSETTSFGYDQIGRLILTTYPDTGKASYCYSDTASASCASAGQLYMTRTDLITGSTSISRSLFVDGIGNVTQAQLTTDPEGTDYTDIAYDGLERKSSVSNPHRSASSSTDGTTQYTYDALARTRFVVQPDGSQTVTSYAGNQTTVTDEAGQKRTSQTDGLGRLTTVWEDPGAAPHLNYETDYQYDALGNLIRVDQKGGDSNSAHWRTRTFAYDSLSQLLCAANPEIAIVTCPNPDNGSYTAGTIRYGYDNDGNVVSKTAPSPNQPQSGTATVATTYAYDKVNRLTGRSYNDSYSLNPSTPAVLYGYDGKSLSGCGVAPPALPDSYPIGERTSMCDGSGATSWSHDQMGRVAAESRTIKGSTNITKTITYAPYNLDGSLASVTYPSGRIVTYAPGGAGRPLSAIETAHSINYLTNAMYTPAGALDQFMNGGSISGAFTYNSRLQPLQLYFTAGTISSATLTQLQQAACPTTAATLMSRSYNFGAGTNDNGNVQSMADCLNTDRTQNFDYDSLNRLADAYTTGTGTVTTNWGEVYTIDPWGNLTNIAPKTGWKNSELLNAAPASAQNQLNGFCYDTSGNTTGPTPCTSSTYVYDAANRLLAAGGMSYIYDGDGQRVEKCTEGTTPGTCAASATGTLYWTGTGSAALAETDLTGAALEEYVFFNGGRVARRDGTGNTVHYYFADHLGSTAIITSAAGGIQKSSVYYPYGGEIPVSGASFANNYKFTGKERDAESGLDDFDARYYGSSFGRFMTPDWAARPTAVPYANFGDPQSLNLYGYVRNDPVSRADADGHDWKGKENLLSDAMPFETFDSYVSMFDDDAVSTAPDVDRLANDGTAQNTAQLNIQVIRSDNLNKSGQAAVNAQLGDLKTDMGKIGVGVNITSDSTRSNIDLKNPGSFDKGAIPYFFVTSKEAGSATSASGFFGKTAGVVINEFANSGDKVVATHETLHILRGDIYAGKNGASWGRELHVGWETFKLEHGWTGGMGWLTDAARNPPNQ